MSEMRGQSSRAFGAITGSTQQLPQCLHNNHGNYRPGPPASCYQVATVILRSNFGRRAGALAPKKLVTDEFEMNDLESLLRETEKLVDDLTLCCNADKKGMKFVDAEDKVTQYSQGESVTSHQIAFRAKTSSANASDASDPQSCRQRLQWSKGLHLEYILAVNLKPGTIEDGLEGVKNMTEQEVLEACAQFSCKAKDVILKAWLSLKETGNLESPLTPEIRIEDPAGDLRSGKIYSSNRLKLVHSRNFYFPTRTCPVF
jgi:hypothetical protein